MDWLADAKAQGGSVGEKAIRRICDYSERIASRALPEDSAAINRAIGEIHTITNNLCELRNSVLTIFPSFFNQLFKGRYDNEGLASRCAIRLKELVGTKESSGLLPEALSHSERIGGGHPAHTTAGRLDQALRWLDNPGGNDGGLGARAIQSITAHATKLAQYLNPQDRNRLLSLWSVIFSLFFPPVTRESNWE